MSYGRCPWRCVCESGQRAVGRAPSHYHCVSCDHVDSTLTRSLHHSRLVHDRESLNMFTCRMCGLVLWGSWQYLAHLRQYHGKYRSDLLQKCVRSIKKRVNYSQNRDKILRQLQNRIVTRRAVKPQKTVSNVTLVQGQSEVNGNDLDLSAILSQTQMQEAIVKLVTSEPVSDPVHHDHSYTSTAGQTPTLGESDSIESTGLGETEDHLVLCSAEETDSATVCEESACQPTKHLSPQAQCDRINLTKPVTYTCCICSKYFRQREALLGHMWTHADGRLYQCTLCGQSFPQRGQLAAHTAAHRDDKPYTCTICTKSFSQRGHLKTHMASHTDRRPFSCDVCGRGFTLRHHLTRHSKVHSGALLYACDVCSARFTNQTNLTLHMKGHAEVTTLPCALCDKRFALRRSLVKHVRTHMTR